jgi:tetratricopeptide (TPR) repeat protein
VLYDKRGLFDYSGRSYDRVLKIDYEQVYAHYNDGLGYMRAGEYENARKSLERAFVADPSRSEVLQYLAQTFIALGDAEHAKEALDHYAYKEWDQNGVPWNPSPELRAALFSMYSTIGLQLAAEGKPETAADALIRAGSVGYQDASPRDLRLVSEQLALNLLKLGRVEPAIVVYRQMLARDDMDNTTRRNLALLLSRQGRNEEALQAMQRVVHDEPHDWAPWYICASFKAVIGTYDNDSILADLRNAAEKNREEVFKSILEDTTLRAKLKGDPRAKEILGQDIP